MGVPWLVLYVRFVYLRVTRPLPSGCTTRPKKLVTHEKRSPCQNKNQPATRVESGWRFFDTGEEKANILLGNYVKITQPEIDAWVHDYEKTKNGSLDFLLVDSHQNPICLLEAKKEILYPLIAKEPARKYAKTVQARFVILSNGIVHYLWGTHKGNPKSIYKFPSPAELRAIKLWNPDREVLAGEPVGIDYIVAVRMPDYAERPGWEGSVAASKDFIWNNGLRFLRPYQLSAIQHLQKAVAAGKDRFLFEMATGTGTTLTSAAVIRLFLRTENARRVLFLVDRLELEDQAWKAFVGYLKPDYSTFIYKEHIGDWPKADIVVTTIQSLMAHDKYRYEFNPTDFDLLISDESHRSISGNARAVFEYFHGYKLGLTATPKDYLKGVDPEKIRNDDPREIERRMLRALKYFFKAYIVDQDIRKIISTKDFHALHTHPTLTIAQFKEVAPTYRDVIPGYIKDYINLERFAA